MPTYTYRCDEGHVTELVLPIADDKPETVPCEGAIPVLDDDPRLRAIRDPISDDDVALVREVREASTREIPCSATAARVFHAPIAVHWSGAGGSYHEDVYRNDSGRYGWKRRKNAGDSLPIEVN